MRNKKWGKNLLRMNFNFLYVYFLMWTIFKVFFKSVTLLLLFYVWDLIPGGVGSELPTRGIGIPWSLHWSLTTGPPGKPLRVNCKGYSVSPAPAVCFLFLHILKLLMTENVEDGKADSEVVEFPFSLISQLKPQCLFPTSLGDVQLNWELLLMASTSSFQHSLG